MPPAVGKNKLNLPVWSTLQRAGMRRSRQRLSLNSVENRLINLRRPKMSISQICSRLCRPESLDVWVPTPMANSSRNLCAESSGFCPKPMKSSSPCGCLLLAVTRDDSGLPVQVSFDARPNPADAVLLTVEAKVEVASANDTHRHGAPTDPAPLVCGQNHQSDPLQPRRRTAPQADAFRAVQVSILNRIQRCRHHPKSNPKPRSS